MDLVDEELHFLILRYLQSGPCKNAAKALKDDVEKHRVLPKKIDWEGRKYPHAYDQLVKTHPHIASDHLKKICLRLPGLLDEKFPPNVCGVQSLLGAGSQSLLRSEKTAQVSLRPSSYLHCSQNSLLPLPNRLKDRPHLLRCLQGKEYTNLQRPAEGQPLELYSNYQLWRRFLGHLSAVYCVLYDRTGNFIFTGSDDKLIKIWSAITGRLLATLRGHDGEIVDIAVDYENTLLASGSCDKLVRIWCLKTTACLAVLHGHTATITSLQFCPFVKTDGRYLMSTGEDATVCFWYYNKGDTEFESKPIKFIERSRMGVKMLCSSFSAGGLFLATGNSDSVIRIYCLLSGRPEKISELEAHNAMVDSIQYSHHSDRFISGSKDGTARIWRHRRSEWLNLILTLKGDNSQDEESSSLLKVNMVAWTADDDFVLTAASDFSVRVWCSGSGQPIRSLKGHEEDVFVIECASFNNNLVVTAGHDGRIKLWDISTGRTLFAYYNMIDGQGFGAAYDCKWAPHDCSFSATDSHGHLMRFGVGRNERLSEEKIPSELYFHTDYRGLLRDMNGHVLDELTQRAVHLLSPPFLVDVDAMPYPPKYQRLVPGRENLPEKYLKATLVHLADGDREVQDQDVPWELLHPATSHPSQSAVCLQCQRQSNSSPNTHSNNSMQSESESTHTAQSQQSRENSGCSCPPAATTQSNIPSDSAACNTVSRAVAESQRYLRRVISGLSDHVWRCTLEHMQEVTERERSGYLEEVARRQHYDKEHQSTFAPEPVYLRTRKRQPDRGGQSSLARDERLAGEQAATNRLTAKALYDTDLESDEEMQDLSTPPLSADSSSEREGRNVRTRRTRTTDGMQSDGGSYGCSSSPSDSADSSEYSDWEVDNKTNLQPPSRKSVRKIVTFKSPTPSPDSFSKQALKSAPSQRRQPSSRAKRARRRAQKLTEQLNSSMTEDSTDGERRDPTIIPEWLTTDQPHRSPYFPQMGDEVMYFYQGHKLYVEEVMKERLYEPKNLPWDRNPHLKVQELARVTGIKFEIQGSRLTRLCCLKLNAIFPDTGKSTGTCFTVKYHDMEGVIDFLVLRQFFATSQHRNWQEGDNFRSIIDKKWYTGSVRAHVPYDKSQPDSQFLCLQVTWDDGSTEKMSPWDLEPLTDDAPDEKLNGGEVTEEDRISLQYLPAAHEWPEHGKDEECSRISECLEQLMGYSVSEQFNAPVDLNRIENYALCIAYPMDLSTIRARLDSGFYRRVSSIMFDVRKIESNAEEFNAEGAKIIRNARKVTDICREILERHDCRDIKAIHDSHNPKADSSADQHLQMVKSKSNDRGKTRAFDWKSALLDLLEDANDNPDSAPFKEPVDIAMYPDYPDVVDDPIDLGTIEQNVLHDEYKDMKEVFKDIRRVFSNSKKYNTSKRSKIYSMTMRLSIYMETKINELTARERKYASSSTSSTRSTRYTTRHLSESPTNTTFSRTRRSVPARASRSVEQPSCSYSSEPPSTSSSSAATPHYSTRSSTGRLKPKQFGDYMVGSDIGSKIHVTPRKSRRIVESSDDERSPPVVKSGRRGRRSAATVSDYDKETDEDSDATEERVESDQGVRYKDSSDDAGYSEDSTNAGRITLSRRTAHKRPRRPIGSRTGKRARMDNGGHEHLNGSTRATRHRTVNSVGIYKEASDNEFASDSSDIYPSSKSKGSRWKVKSRR